MDSLPRFLQDLLLHQQQQQQQDQAREQEKEQSSLQPGKGNNNAVVADKVTLVGTIEEIKPFIICSSKDLNVLSQADKNCSKGNYAAAISMYTSVEKTISSSHKASAWIIQQRIIFAEYSEEKAKSTATSSATSSRHSLLDHCIEVAECLYADIPYQLNGTCHHAYQAKLLMYMYTEKGDYKNAKTKAEELIAKLVSLKLPTRSVFDYVENLIINNLGEIDFKSNLPELDTDSVNLQLFERLMNTLLNSPVYNLWVRSGTATDVTLKRDENDDAGSAEENCAAKKSATNNNNSKFDDEDDDDKAILDDLMLVFSIVRKPTPDGSEMDAANRLRSYALDDEFPMKQETRYMLKYFDIVLSSSINLLETALESVNNYLLDFQEDEKKQSGLLVLKGMLLFWSGDQEKGFQSFESAIELWPDNGDAHFVLFECLVNHCNTTTARSCAHHLPSNLSNIALKSFHPLAFAFSVSLLYQNYGMEPIPQDDILLAAVVAGDQICLAYSKLKDLGFSNNPEIIYHFHKAMVAVGKIEEGEETIDTLIKIPCYRHQFFVVYFVYQALVGDLECHPYSYSSALLDAFPRPDKQDCSHCLYLLANKYYELKMFSVAKEHFARSEKRCSSLEYLQNAVIGRLRSDLYDRPQFGLETFAPKVVTTTCPDMSDIFSYHNNLIKNARIMDAKTNKTGELTFANLTSADYDEFFKKIYNNDNVDDESCAKNSDELAVGAESFPDVFPEEFSDFPTDFALPLQQPSTQKDASSVNDLLAEKINDKETEELKSAATDEDETNEWVFVNAEDCKDDKEKHKTTNNNNESQLGGGDV